LNAIWSKDTTVTIPNKKGRKEEWGTKVKNPLRKESANKEEPHDLRIPEWALANTTALRKESEINRRGWGKFCGGEDLKKN